MQGEFWHYSQGSDKQIADQLRAALLEQGGLEVIFIDEADALRDPQFYVKEALAHRDHSALSKR